MRKLTSHKVNGLNEDLDIEVLDEPGQGNACHKYSIAYCLNPGTDAGGVNLMCQVKFQNGPVKEAGINGISNEALLAIVEDRLAGFQSGQFACRENAIALTKLQEAMMWLQKRTRDRMARGVEGTNQR
jgi:hypothetical protein